MSRFAARGARSVFAATASFPLHFGGGFGRGCASQAFHNVGVMELSASINV